MFPTEIFADREKLEFEGQPFYGPKDYDKYLTFEYGDYMQLPPEDRRKTHGFNIVDLEHGYREYLNS